MKANYLVSVFIFLYSCIVSYAQTARDITLENPVPISRTDELIILKRSDVEKKFGSSLKYFSAKANGIVLPLQFDDFNGDGKWDEALFLYSFKPGEKTTITITPTSQTPEILTAQRAHVRLRKKNADDTWGPAIKIDTMPYRNPPTDFGKQPLPLYLTEGPAWENDKVGFRLYYDLRNGKDIWGKLTPRMVLDSVGTSARPSYHDYANWGMDVLKVGKSLGAGSLAILLPLSDHADTLIRLGGEDVQRAVFRQISDGPVRASFELTYDLQLQGKPVQIVEQISIWGGQYFYESKVWIRGAPAKARLVTGIVNLHENISRSFSIAQTQVLFSHGSQSENKDQLGMAILVPVAGYQFTGTAPASNSEILNTYFVAQSIAEASPCIFRFIAGWEKTNQRFSTFKSFETFVTEEGRKMSEKIRVRL